MYNQIETSCLAVLYDGSKFGELSMMGTKESICKREEESLGGNPLTEINYKPFPK